MIELPEGVTLKIMPHGQERYYATAPCQGRLVQLGWYTTPKRAHQAILKLNSKR